MEGPRAEQGTGGSRVIATIGGHELWFECSDVSLHPSPEAFAAVFFIPALAAGAVLEVEAPLESRWLAGTRGLLPIYRAWWGYEERHPIQASPADVSVSSGPRERGLCFTGGVDSFHALLRMGAEVDRLVYVHGYDIRLSEPERMQTWEQSLREVAAELGKKVAVVRTNLREHPLFTKVSWVRTHGAALAAVGHLLSDRLHQLQIASSYRYEREIPWGSSWRIDPLWSSSRLEVRHLDATLGRHQKLMDISAEPVVWQHLRVCWEHLTPDGNCSRCEKCLRTMVPLQGLGLLDRYEVFDRSRDLVELVDGLPAAPAELVAMWEDMAQEPLPSTTRAAAERLVARSSAHTSRRRLLARLGLTR